LLGTRRDARRDTGLQVKQSLFPGKRIASTKIGRVPTWANVILDIARNATDV
jgi:hypothetical protein